MPQSALKGPENISMGRLTLGSGRATAYERTAVHIPRLSGAGVSQTLEPARPDLVCSREVTGGDGYGRSTMPWDLRRSILQVESDS